MHFLTRFSFIACLFMLLRPFSMQAQGEAENAQGSLTLQSEDGRRTVKLKEGAPIAVKYTIDPRTFRDLRLDAVMDSSVVISGDTVEFHYLDHLVIRDQKLYSAGKKVLLASLVVSFLFYLLVLATVLAAANPGAIMFILGIALVVLAIPTVVAMPGGIIAGAVMMGVASKTYQLRRNWRLSAQAGKHE